MREYGPGNPLVFSHIPKSAGTSLRAALAEALQSGRVVYGVDRSLVAGYDNIDGLRGPARDNFIMSPDELPLDATLVTGHISPGTTRARFPDADHVTTLRHPQLRVISQWTHGRALSDFDLRHFGGGTANAFRVARGSLKEYLFHDLIAPNVDNTIARFLAWPHPSLHPTRFIPEQDDDAILEAAIESLERFAHVGVVEDENFLGNLSDWLGRRLVETRLNERTSMSRHRRPDLARELTPATHELLRHRTRLDTALWLHVAQRSMKQRSPQDVLDAAWDVALERYAKAAQAPHHERPVRRAVEIVYGWGSAVRGRRRPWN